MIASLLGLIGIDLKREVRGLAVTVALAIVGAFLALLAIGIGLYALYLWLALNLGVFPALGIVGVGSALLAIILLLVAFRRRRARPARHAENPVQASAATLAEATEQAVNEATDAVRNGSRKQMYSAILIAALAGMLLGRRL